MVEIHRRGVAQFLHGSLAPPTSAAEVGDHGALLRVAPRAFEPGQALAVVCPARAVASITRCTATRFV
jgi:hypothetical protein